MAVLFLAAQVPDAKYSILVGSICLPLTFLANGTHGLFTKWAGPGMSPFVYVFYLTVGVFASCTLLVAAVSEPLLLSWPGVAGGALLAISLSLYVVAVMMVGIVWSGTIGASTATVTSFLWGKVFFHEPSTSVQMCFIGLVLILASILGISALLTFRLRQLAASGCGQQGPAPREFAVGIFCAVLNAVTGGSAFAVGKLQPADQQGLSFIWAQAFGMLVAETALLGAAAAHDTWAARAEGAPLWDDDPLVAEKELRTLVRRRWEPRRLLPCALAQGAVLAAANITTTAAALSPLGVAVAQPVRESGQCIAVLLGALVLREYGEPDGRFVGLLALLAALEMAGITALVMGGRAPS